MLVHIVMMTIVTGMCVRLSDLFLEGVTWRFRALAPDGCMYSWLVPGAGPNSSRKEDFMDLRA